MSVDEKQLLNVILEKTTDDSSRSKAVALLQKTTKLDRNSLVERYLNRKDLENHILELRNRLVKANALIVRLSVSQLKEQARSEPPQKKAKKSTELPQPRLMHYFIFGMVIILTAYSGYLAISIFLLLIFVFGVLSKR